MFEHSLYEAEPVAEPLHEGDLFYHYELPNWKLGPRIYKILGISAVANLLVFFIFTATPILTMKGCDSPLVGNVCQVLDTLYVGSKLFGTDREYVDAVYDKTKIGDSDVTFVDVTGDTPPIDYPEGYFQIANPDEFAAMQAMANDPNAAAGGTVPGIPPGVAITSPSAGNDLFNTRQHVPRANPHAVEGDLPSGFGGSTVATNSGKHGGKKSGTPEASPSPSPTPAQDLTTDAVQGVQINKLPLNDFADLVNSQLEQKKVDLSKNFSVTLNAVIGKDGLLDTSKSRFDASKDQGDPAMVNTGKEAMQALGMTGFLQYLSRLGIDKAVVTLTQDDNQIAVQILVPAKSPEHAKTMASGMNGIILVGKATAKNPSTERTLLDGAQVATDGKNTFVLNFAIPKPAAQAMIAKALQEAQAKKQAQPQPSSDSLSKPNNNTALRQ
ncbi:MAG: hypothetical protein ACJ73D_02765 [Pyrinomonadaceae bacterium]